MLAVNVRAMWPKLLAMIMVNDRAIVAEVASNDDDRWTAITQLAHHGMLFVPIGYTFGPGMFKMDSIRGGSPYGAGVFAGDGTRGPSDTELALAEHQGEYMAAIVKRKNWKGLKKTVLSGVKEDKRVYRIMANVVKAVRPKLYFQPY
ncbi:hypothetical protein RHSIM_Rhsim08G0112400 [Rhododendron simsii]|uniref:NAD(P)H dehydrogenase (quinone) n=1 Tax=Rhododendron simsii TaxID=118357 RepID=A0A834LE63_RHOSS|nr:hypothetical protein RHSIM_Rhsim08G0112400 [Rhododendron simsii]